MGMPYLILNYLRNYTNYKNTKIHRNIVDWNEMITENENMKEVIVWKLKVFLIYLTILSQISLYFSNYDEIKSVLIDKN